tara:strand:+ start:218 stop:358 length:141 start_codon:yes stop_codon:yes gene_type:complete
VKKKIKCSQCNKEFEHGFEYRMHWEKNHLDYAIKFAEELNKKNERV